MTKIIHTHEILESANGFYHLATSEGFKEEYILVPQFVNMALACELYLKAIWQKTKGSFPHIHLLEELYNRLDDAEKNGIRDEMRKAQANSEEVRLVELEKRRGTHYERTVPTLSDEVIEENVKSIVRESSNLFPEWRYIFEKENPHFRMSGFFHDFAIALKEYATSIITI